MTLDFDFDFDFDFAEVQKHTRMSQLTVLRKKYASLVPRPSITANVVEGLKCHAFMWEDPLPRTHVSNVLATQ